MKTSSPFALVFDCACSGLSLAVLRDGDVVAAHAETAATGQAARLAPAIQDVLARAGIGAKDLSLVGVTTGPGSFTGIRIGLAMARGLALALKVPLASCSTFAAALENRSPLQRRRDDVDLILAIDSRRDEIFIARGAAMTSSIATPDAIVASLPVGLYGLVGDAAAQLGAAFAASRRDAWIAFSDLRPPIAANFGPTLVAPGVEHWRARNASDGLPRPLYLRPADVTLPKTARR